MADAGLLRSDPQRNTNTFDFSPENTQAAQIRQGIFDIWWSRDYSTYGTALTRIFRSPNTADRMYVFVRKDIAAQVWNLGVGDGQAGSVFTTVDVNQCNANWQPTEANLVLNINSPTVSPFNHPRQIAIAPDGRIYAAEEGNHRVSVFNADGSFAFAFVVKGLARPAQRPNRRRGGKR